MTWILKDQRVVSGIDPVTSGLSYDGLKSYMQWFVGTYLVSRGYQTFIDDTAENDWYYGVRKNWTNKFNVNITTSYVSKFQPPGQRINVYAWEVLNAFAPPIHTNDKHLPAYLHRAFCCDCDITSHHMGLANPY